MRFFSLPLLLIFAFPAFAGEAVLKFTLTKANGTPMTYEFLIPNDDTNQGVTLSQDEAVQQQHNAGVAALTWAKQFYGAHEIYLRSVHRRSQLTGNCQKSGKSDFAMFVYAYYRTPAGYTRRSCRNIAIFSLRTFGLDLQPR